MHSFGSCCKDLRAAMSEPPVSMFQVNDAGVLYLAVGYVETEQGPSWFDMAVLFCPFCGARLQTREEVADSGA